MRKKTIHYIWSFCALLLIVMMFFVQGKVSAKEYWGDETDKVLKPSLCINEITGYKMSKTKVTFSGKLIDEEDYSYISGNRHTYKVAKNIRYFQQLGSSPFGYKSHKSTRSKFKQWLVDCYKDKYGLGYSIVVKKGTIVGYYMRS